VSLAAVLAALLSAGCGYTLAGRGSFLPEHIRTIGVPLFVNNTQVFEVEQKITERVRSELLGRGRYTVLQETTGVDAVLIGEITSITYAPSAFTAQQQASRYAVTLVAKVEFKDLKTDKVLWSNPSMQFREEFEVTTATVAGDVTAFFGQNTNALERMAAEFARTLVSAILEAF
jgi:hypothetical protein